MESIPKKRILVCPLDWGLGHATRCVPIINELLKQQVEVVLAAEGRPLQLLQQEFPQLEAIPFPGYEIHYPKRLPLGLSMLLQAPRILYRINKETRDLDLLLKKHSIDAVISDNRYGLHSRKVPCVFITHQLTVKMPSHLSFLESLTHSVTQRFVKHYTFCWVPDKAEPQGLSGDLSHKFRPLSNTSFIGPLSRFSYSPPEAPEYPLVVLLSGPEPRRTLFEDKLKDQLKALPVKSLLIRGVPGEGYRQISDTLTSVGHLEAKALQKVLQNAEFVLSRPGYSTLMDLCVLKKRGIFIPTPGQTEQEYLGRELMESGKAFCVNETDLSVADALQKAKAFPALGFEERCFEDHKTAVKDFLNRIFA